MKKKLKNIGKRILSFTLSVVLAAGLLPAAGTARAEQTEEFALDNGYIRAEVSEENGGFAIRTVEGNKVNKDDNNKNLLFHSDEDDTSFTSFQVIRNGEKKEYIFGGSYPGSSEVKTVRSNEEIRSEWSVDNVTFTQIISLVNSGSNEHGAVHIGYTAKNTGEAAEIKCRILLDTALGNQDYAYYNIGNNNQLTESEITLLEGGYQKSFYAVDNPQNPAVTAYTINASVDNRECIPYQTTFAHWNNLAATVFDYTPDSDMTFTNPNNKAYLTADSAYALYFDMGELEKDKSADIATNYGIFSNETVDREDSAAVNVIGPDAMELTEDKTAYKNEGKFTINTEIENISETTYERVRVVVYTTGKITPLDETGTLQEELYCRDYTNFVPGQRQTMEWSFQALPGDEGVYSKIQYKVYDVSDGATLNTGMLLDENLMGDGRCYLLCPGSVNEIPAIQFTGSSPDVLYPSGTRNLYVTGTNFSMLENTGEYTLMLSRVDGQKFLGAYSAAIPAEQIKIDSAKNSMTLVMNDECPGEIPEGQYQLTFDYTDSAKQDLTAPALRFQVKQEEKYRNDSYGILTVEKDADKNYHIRTFADEKEYQDGIDNGEIDREAMLLEFRGSFSKNTKASTTASKVYQGISLNDGDNVMVLNNCLDIRKGMVTITERGGSVTVDFDASIYTTGAGTSVWSGVAALTELRSGEDYGLIPYEENGDRGDFDFETITLLWPGIGQAAQNLMGFLMDFKYGELGVIPHENAPETRVVAFGAAMDLSFVIPKISQEESNKSLLGDAYNAAVHAGNMDAQTLRSINEQIPYNTETVNTSADSADEEDEEDDDSFSASVQIDDVLFGGKYLGVNLNIGLGIPGYVEGMPSLEGELTIKTIGDWEVGVKGECDFSVCCFEGEIYIKSRNGIPVPDKIKFFIGDITPGINVDGMGVLWLQGGGGGIENLYDTIFLQDCIPPLKLILEAQFSLMQVISARASLEVSLRGFGIELTDGKVANAIPVLNSARLQFDWYPSFYFLSSVNVSIYDAIVGSGYIVVEDSGFFEFFVNAALQIPEDIPIVGGTKIASAGLGANNQKIWGQVSVLGTNLGVVYYWGGNLDWGGGAEAVPTYPNLVAGIDVSADTALMSAEDVPVYYDKETGRTLYAHMGTNLNSDMQRVSDIQTVSYITSVKSLNNTLSTSIDAKRHTISLAENGKDKILILEWEAESREEAEADAAKIRIEGNVNGTNKTEYPLTLLEHDKAAELQESANANLNWQENTKKVSLAVSFTKQEDFKNLWTVTAPKESSVLLYDIEPLPELSEDTEITVSEGGKVTAKLQGTEMDKFDSVSFIAVPDSAGGLAGIAENVLRQRGRSLNTKSSQDAQLVYRADKEELSGSSEIAFDLPDDFESGNYKLRLIAEDNGGNYYSEIEKTFSYENKNQPAQPDIVKIENAGDYRAAVTLSDNGEEFDGYLFTAYDKEGNPVTGLNQLLYYKDGSAVRYEADGRIAESLEPAAGEFTIGGHYEYQPEPEENGEAKPLVTAGFSAGEYTVEVKKWKRISNGEKILTSKGAAGNIVIAEPEPAVIEVSADKEGKKITEIINKETCERFVYKDSELTLTLSADQKITGTWSLDNKESGEIKDLTQTVSLPFTELSDGVHTLEFVGRNENGDASAATYVFGIDTTGPRLLLSSPVSGSFFSHSDGTLMIEGITDKDAVLSVYDITKDKEIVSKQELAVSEEDGSFVTEIRLDKTVAKHRLRIFMEDSVGNVSEKEVQVISDALGSIKSLELFSQEKNITNQKISADNICELSVRAVLSDGSVTELNDPTLIEWKQISVEGEAVLSEMEGRVILSIPEGAEGIVTARFLVNDAGAYSVSASFGESNDPRISLDSEDTKIEVDDGWYTGKEVKPEVQVWYKGAKLTESEDYTVEFENNIEATETAADTVLQTQFPARQTAGIALQTQLLPRQEAPRAVVTGINNYKDSISREFKIYYLPVEDLQGNTLYEISGVGEKYYTSDISIVPQKGYEISTNQFEGYQTEGISITEEGHHSVEFYIRRTGDGALTDKITADIIIDKTAPTGEIRLDAKSWNRFLENITFGQYKVKNYQIIISAEDEISGLSDIIYVVSEEAYSSVSELINADLNWKEYKEDDRPEIGKNKNQVIYARLTDNAGNQRYISSEGILIDDIVPEITNAAIKEGVSLKDTQADITFVLNEAGTYYYAVLPEDSEAPDFDELKAQKISGAVMGSGYVNADTAGQPVTLTVTGLSAGTSYKLYVAAEDRAVELGTNKPAGNRSEVTASEAVTTKLHVPVITEQPEIKGTYGTKVCDMELIPGVAKVGENSIRGIFSVDSEEIPSTDSETEYEVIFTPENDSYAEVSVLVRPKVAPRALTAEEVVVSEIHGSFVYNKTEHKPPVTVSDSYAEITPKDYEILYQNNINAGTAEIIVRGRHNYTGERKISFEIEKCGPKISIEAGKESYRKTEGDKDFKLDGIVTDSDGKISYWSENEEVVQVSEDGIVHVVGKGKALVKVSILESGNYKASETVEIVIDVKEKEEEIKHTNSADDSVQDTGDSMQPGKYMIIMALAGMFMAAAVCGRRKRK